MKSTNTKPMAGYSPMARFLHQRHPLANGNRGFSIVEMMVAVTLSLIMFAVIIELFVSNKQGYKLQEGASVLNENARFAMNEIQRAMRMADHWAGIDQADVTALEPLLPMVTEYYRVTLETARTRFAMGAQVYS